jgi:hypothetical protein
MSASGQTELRSFSYATTMKLDDANIGGKLVALYPGISSLAFQSRNFSSYEECANSCRELMDQLVACAKSGGKLKLGAEVNPLFNNGQPTLSKDWSLGEVARFWIYEKSMEQSGHIHAIGQARIFGSVVSEARPQYLS